LIANTPLSPFSPSFTLYPPFGPCRCLHRLAPLYLLSLLHSRLLLPREACVFFSLFFLHYFFYLLCLYLISVLLDPRLFSVMAQLFVYMESKERFLMRTREWRTYCIEIESRGGDIRDMQSHSTCCTGKISYGIGIFGTGKSDGGTKCGITEFEYL